METNLCGGVGCMLEVSFDVMQSCAIAAAVVLVGRAIVKRVKFFQTYCIPGVIVCGKQSAQVHNVKCFPIIFDVFT